MCFLRCHGLAVPGESTRFFLNDVLADFLFKNDGLVIFKYLRTDLFHGNDDM